MHDLWRAHRDQVAFAVVYIAEIHPTDGWQVTPNDEDDVKFAQPTTLREREHVATACALNLQIEMPVVIDEMDNAVANAYGALPDRLYLVDRGGTIGFQGEMGPEGFRPEALSAAIDRALTT